jgi:Tfp pilus assembly major pilin PilA
LVEVAGRGLGHLAIAAAFILPRFESGSKAAGISDGHTSPSAPAGHHPHHKELFPMYRKYLVAAAVIAALAGPAFAATTMTPAPTAAAPTAVSTKPTYYVSQDKTTLKCYVVTKIGKNGQKIGKTGYPTKSAATKALKAAPECNKM